MILKDLVNYQPGTIISKEVLRKEKGSVTLFAFDAEETLSEHTAPFDALVEVLDGEAEVTIDGTPFTLKANDAVVMPADKPHALRAITRFKMLLVMIKV